MVPPCFAFLTPPLPSAIALVRLWADESQLRERFRARTLPEAASQPRFVRMLDVDEGLLARSLDGSWLFTPHGGAGVQDALRRTLIAHGWEESQPPEADPDFTGGLNDAQRQWLSLLPGMPSPAATRLCLRCMALCASDTGRELVHTHADAIDQWLRRPQVVLRGTPNAGKTSLLNRLCPDADAIVSDVAGTTRDVLEGTWAIGEHRISLFDTPGIRVAAHAGEAQGIELGELIANTADLVIVLIAPGESGRSPSLRTLVVRSKADIEPTLPTAPALSVATGIGIPELEELVIERLFPALPPELTHSAPDQLTEAL